MSVSLQKGQKVDLTKGNSGLSNLIVGLGWDAVTSKTGLLSKVLGTSKEVNIDCDASAVLLDANNKIVNAGDIVYFGNLQHKSGSVIHRGDNQTGVGDGDDEQISIDLKKVPEDLHHILFIVNIYDCVNRKQDFGMIKNAYIKVYDGSSNKTLLQYNLSEGYEGKTALIIGEVYRHNAEWKFSAIGEATNDVSLKELVVRYTK